MSFDYAHYLAAKASVDDRALNRVGLATLRQLLPSAAPHILEIGAGLGTMPARLIEWGVVTGGQYTLLDVDEQLLDRARSWLTGWTAEQSLPCRGYTDVLELGKLRVRFVAAELNAYLTVEPDPGADVLIANAVLDLVDLPTTLRQLLAYSSRAAATGSPSITTGRRSSPPGTHTTRRSWPPTTGTWIAGSGTAAPEGATGPVASCSICCAPPTLRLCSPDRRTGSCTRTRTAGIHTTRNTSLPASLDTIHDALLDRTPDPGVKHVLADWVATRHAQLAAGDLVYVAHQLDFVGRAPV